MAGRDITIPFGPDKTGGFDLSNLVPEVEPSSHDVQDSDAGADGEADVAETRSDDPMSTHRFTPVRNFESAGDEGFESGDADEPLSKTGKFPPVSGDEVPSEELEEEQAGVDAPGGADKAREVADAAGDAAAAAFAGMQSSLIALKDSIGQGRELKARERERDSFGEKLVIDKEELADREDILANYFALVAEQDNIIDQATGERERLKTQLAQVTAQQEETSDALERMREYNDSQLEPVEAMLGRAKATAEQAKNDERSRKSELNAAESERRKAEGTDDAAMATAKYEVVQAAYEEASARSNAAKDALDQVQKRFDDLKSQIEQAEAPLERSIKDYTAQADDLKAQIGELAETISVARKRRQYCDTVYQYPDETAKLRASVEADEETFYQMDVENEELRDLLAESKERSKIAKIGIIGVIALILLIVILVVFVFK